MLLGSLSKSYRGRGDQFRLSVEGQNKDSKSLEHFPEQISDKPPMLGGDDALWLWGKCDRGRAG